MGLWKRKHPSKLSQMRIFTHYYFIDFSLYLFPFLGFKVYQPSSQLQLPANMNKTLLALLASCTCISLPAEPVADCHFHLLDFLQNGEFDNRDNRFPGSARGLMKNGRYFQLPYGERHRRLTALLEVLEKNDVRDVVVCGSCGEEECMRA